mmetsp:Transcript_27930/g.65674  ORF Transcript_27930/g.65674 Transcript_27930/m.65674 type:complete len:268 (-) Transcript_27930:843-1646(-)
MTVAGHAVPGTLCRRDARVKTDSFRRNFSADRSDRRSFRVFLAGSGVQNRKPPCRTSTRNRPWGGAVGYGRCRNFSPHRRSTPSLGRFAAFAPSWIASRSRTSSGASLPPRFPTSTRHPTMFRTCRYRKLSAANVSVTSRGEGRPAAGPPPLPNGEPLQGSSRTSADSRVTIGELRWHSRPRKDVKSWVPTRKSAASRIAATSRSFDGSTGRHQARSHSKGIPAATPGSPAEGWWWSSPLPPSPPLVPSAERIGRRGGRRGRWHSSL